MTQTSPSYHVATFSVPNEDADSLMGRLYDLGCLGLEEQDDEQGRTILKAYFEDSPAVKRLRDPAVLGGATIVGITTIGLGDWSFRPATFEPFFLGNFKIVPPPDLRSEAESAESDNEQNSAESPPKIIIRPGPAFGTGRHTTTRLVAEAFLKHYDLKKHRTLLDVGTGSGILTLLAYKVGIRNIAAVDISPEALENARENFRLNQTTAFRLESDLACVSGSFDVVLGNLLTPTLLHLKESLVARLVPGGLLIVSGITREEGAGLKAAYEPMTCLETIEDDDWSCFVLKKTSP